MAPRDDELIAGCLDGRPDDFRLLIGRYEPALRAYVTARLAGAESADEVVQESFVRAFFGLSRLRKRGALVSWLLGIATRVIREQRRSRRPRMVGDEVAAARPAPAPAAATESAWLTPAVVGLPAAFREVVLLRYWVGLSCAEIAGLLGLPLGTVTKRLSRAYELLRTARDCGETADGRREVSP